MLLRTASIIAVALAAGSVTPAAAQKVDPGMACVTVVAQQMGAPVRQTGVRGMRRLDGNATRVNVIINGREGHWLCTVKDNGRILGIEQRGGDPTLF